MLTIEAATASLPDARAYDVELVSPYVVRYKVPNEYRKPEGYLTYLRFLAVPLARDVLAALPELAGWEVAGYGDDPLCESAEYARLVNGNARISIHAVRTYGANAYKRVSVETYATDSERRAHDADAFTVTAERAPDAIVKGIRAKSLPRLAEVLARVNGADKAREDAAAEVVAKCASLARRYPELLFRVSEARDAISVATKSGAAIDVRGAEIRKRDAWRLWSRNAELAVDNIDSKAGRAFLKLLNGA